MTPLLSSTLLRTQSDARLAALASGGYERAFEAIVERYRRPLHRWCRRVLPEARAEDAVQATFLKAWAAMQAGTEVGDLKPWLYRIARNAALDNARKAGYDYDDLTEALRVAPGPEADFERRRVIRETLAGVAELPENQREALLQTAAGHSRADIARELDVSEGAVRQLVHRARTALRTAATVLTPLPFASWAAAMGADAGGPTAQRIAELAAGAGSAGVASAAIKTGTVIVAAGVLVAGPGSDLREEVSKNPQSAAAAQASDDPSKRAGEARGDAAGEGTGGARRGEDRGARSGNDHSGGDRRGSGSPTTGDDDSETSSERHRSSGSGRSGSGDDDGRSGSSGSRTGDDGHTGSRSGSGTDDHSGSGSGESGLSGTGSGESSSGPGSGGDDLSSGSSGSGSGSPGPGPDSTLLPPPPDD